MEELDLKSFCKYVLSKQIIVFLIAILVVIMGCTYTFNLKVPMYKSTTTVVLTTEKNNLNTITQYDVTLNENLVTTYSEIIKSKRVLKQVVDKLKLTYSTGELGSMISVNSVSDTEIISISVSNEDNELACNIANEIADIFTKEIVDLYNIENIHVIDKAEISKSPYNMNYKKDIIIYVITGLAIGYLIIILGFYFDTTLKSTEEVEEKIKLPLIGTIPLLNRKNKKNKITSELIVHEKSKSIISEGIKTLRTNLQFSSIDKKLKSVLVVSSIPGEGKSFISANLATAFAQTGKKVLIVDCDMRKGRQHLIFNTKNELGLSDLLISDNIENYQDFFHKTKVNNLFLLTSGTIPPNPSELLGSEKNKKLVDLFTKYFDIVIYDGVPINGLSDSLIMSKIVDKVLLVTELKKTPYEIINNTKKSLEKVDADVAGIIINKIPYKGNSYTYEEYYR